MARFTRLEALVVMLRQGFVPLFHDPDPDRASKALHAVAAGGGRTLEFTHRGDGAYEVFLELERVCQRELPHVVLGAGSVPDAETASLYLNAGASFVVSSTLDPDVARVCNRRKVGYLPGCATPTEIARAEELGAEIVKVFPGGAAGGPELIRSVLGPSRWSRLMPTGGVAPTTDSLSAWFDAGAACVGLGSQLLPSNELAEGHWQAITDRVAATARLVTECRPRPAEEWS
ncbi:bifunctional 4-hydroxy-2-oxoglutarate aldolase/2-dehydro-3-deoxy-phosphogluconate aldolase [Egibacter rhizosphaerae]|uniref:Bifunctional 4-hydroxy-2-oxoglutarate aldolase/2-dehydro-3-deoxy-phosphogluconate aldolase n=1 Tax=Egibacter rhizosphaerae TaxID=1670831 RepID=A0A411YE44_9ACTN|nr:bifunctional 4-hydroxy-2-oxoglutarate aldolase/2-dehydro-3-deoxy-phosphogluconate aldolase [Egibacter rhizosphaerae]QBI19471.1 bifunctional 4-hydroxy-2-oxoglutarate aldolase/2-dehydro-3-deoxy-phosphogluconate aldolase [Egibacter rhizosphaerae]